jgi:hypothetical protein
MREIVCRLMTETLSVDRRAEGRLAQRWRKCHTGEVSTCDNGVAAEVREHDATDRSGG